MKPRAASLGASVGMTFAWLLVPLLPLAPAVHAEEARAPDVAALLERANARLASADTYPRAIELYRELLALQPDHREARLRLAQVLSWSQQLDASLEEYAELRRRFPDDLEIQLGQAEVLSWRGDLERAQAGFEAVLEQQPGRAAEARATRGLARIHRWSGRSVAADRAYARALALEEDGEARAEWDALRGALRPRIEARSGFFSDSSDFDRRDAWLAYSGFQSVATRIGVRLGWIHVSHPQDDVPLAVRSPNDDDRALDLGLTLERTLESGARLGLELGGRQWAHAGDSLYARGHLQHTLPGLGSLGLHLVHEDFGDASSSFEAVQEEVRHTSLAGSLYRPLGARLSAFGRAEIGSISDGNTRQALYAALIYRPFAEHELDLSLAGSGLRYSDASDSYYDPEQDVGVFLGLDYGIPLATDWRFEYRGALGFQSTDERTASESGTLWSSEGALHWDRGPWTLSLRFGVSYSQRSSRYHTRRGGLSIERKL